MLFCALVDDHHVTSYQALIPTPQWPSIPVSQALQVRAALNIQQTAAESEGLAYIDKVALDNVQEVIRRNNAHHLHWSSDDDVAAIREARLTFLGSSERPATGHVYVVDRRAAQALVWALGDFLALSVSSVPRSVSERVRRSTAEVREGLLVEVSALADDDLSFAGSVDEAMKENADSYAASADREVYEAAESIAPDSTSLVLAYVSADRLDGRSAGRTTRFVRGLDLKSRPELAEAALTVHQAAMAPLDGHVQGRGIG